MDKPGAVPTESAPKVSVRNLSKIYQGRNRSEIPVFSEINLDINPEEFICTVGPSGCGKTTFIKIIDGLAPATSGSRETKRRLPAGCDRPKECLLGY
jgi:NitT/TauT family transport system ATP-binding protein